MVAATINDELTLSYPKSFRVMGADELRQAYQADPAHIWGIRDEGRHAIVAIFTHDAGSAGKLFGKMVTEKDLAKRAEKKVHKAMRANGYRLGGFFSRELAGHPAYGFRYAYEVGDVAQSAQAIVFRVGVHTYTVYTYTRRNPAPELAVDIDALLDSLQA